MKVFARFLTFALVAGLSIACSGQAEPTPTKTPRPPVSPTPLPTVALALPAIESSAPQAEAPATDTPLAPADAFSPLATPTATPPVEPTATATPGLEAQPPVSVLAANLSCGEGCNAGNPDGAGLAILNRETGQFNIWAIQLDPLEGQEYEGWLVKADEVESSGRFGVAADGTVAEFSVLTGSLKDEPWTSFVLTIEPEPDDSDEPAAPHSIGGPLRATVMGEALYSRFDMPCQQCHGAQAEGGSASALRGTALPYGEFEAAVRTRHPSADYSDVVIASRDLQHLYAWLVASP